MEAVSSNNINNSINIDLLQEKREEINIKRIENSKEGTGVESHTKEQQEDQMKKVVEELNNTVQSIHKNLKFELHDKSERLIVKVIDSVENKVIKEIPSKEALDMIGRIKDMVGIIIDEKI